MRSSLITESGYSGKQGFLRCVKSEGSGRDKLIAVPAEHNPSESIRPKGVCLSPCSALDRTSKDDPKRSRLAVRTSLHAGGHIKNSDVRGRNDPRASREGGLIRNPPPLGEGRFKPFPALNCCHPQEALDFSRTGKSFCQGNLHWPSFPSPPPLAESSVTLPVHSYLKACMGSKAEAF